MERAVSFEIPACFFERYVLGDKGNDVNFVFNLRNLIHVG